MTKNSTKLDDLLIRADAEGEEKEEKREDKGGRKDASAGTQESTEIADAVRGCMDAVEKMADAMGRCMDRMDRQDARLDAMDSRRDASEEEDKREDGEEDEERREDKGRKDAKRRDEGEESEGEDKPERVVADKKRRDNVEDVKEEKAEADAARRDAKRRDESEEEEEEMHADSADMATVQASVNKLMAENKRLNKTVEDLLRITPRPITDADSAALLDAQAVADSVYVEMGLRAPAPQVNEDLSTYRRRVAIDLQKHSPRLDKVNLWAVADDVAFGALETQIYADAVEAARSPVNLGPLKIRGVKRNSGGHEITEYFGDSTGWMCELSIPATRGSVSVGELLKTGHAR